MTRDELTYHDEALSSKEKRTLVLRFLAVLFFGSIIGGFAAYFLFFSGFFQKDFQTPAIVFAVFFYGILAFILFIHGSNAFQKTKRVYEGVVTEKHSHSTKFRNSSQNTTYSIELDGVEFSVDLLFFNRCHKGDTIRLKVLKKARVFDLEVIPKTQSLDARRVAQNNRITESSEEEMAPEFLSIIRTRFMRAVVFRGIVGSVGGFFVFYLILFTGLILIDVDVEAVMIVYYLSLLVAIGSVLLLNLKTIRYIRDLFAKKILFENDTVVDVIESNMPKPGPNSIRTYQGYYYRNDLFYYVKTSKHWIEITPELAKTITGGDLVKIGFSKHSKVPLSVKKL